MQLQVLVASKAVLFYNTKWIGKFKLIQHLTMRIDQQWMFTRAEKDRIVKHNLIKYQKRWLSFVTCDKLTLSQMYTHFKRTTSYKSCLQGFTNFENAFSEMRRIWLILKCNYYIISFRTTYNLSVSKQSLPT